MAGLQIAFAVETEHVLGGGDDGGRLERHLHEAETSGYDGTHGWTAAGDEAGSSGA